MQGNWGSNGTSGVTTMETAISTDAFRRMEIGASKQSTDRQNNQVDYITLERMGLLKPTDQKCTHCVSPAACEYNGRCQKGFQR